ncbi:hypothetical protein RQP46_006773 [Phenoliferia psychrophenolica]
MNSLLGGKPKVDVSPLPSSRAWVPQALSPQEREIFEKYGKVPGQNFAAKLQPRKFFDSGDYAMSKAGAAPSSQVGTAIPTPADIPHASPPTNSSQPGTSPTTSAQTLSNMSPGKEPVPTNLTLE